MKLENRAVIYMCACCIDCLCVIFLLDFGTVQTVWYLLNCSDSVICFELFRQCDIFWTVPTVWYLLSFILSLSWHIQCIIAFCTVVVTYKSIYIRMLLSLIQIGIQKIYCSSLCFLFIVLSTIFVFLSLFSFGSCVVYLS